MAYREKTWLDVGYDSVTDFRLYKQTCDAYGAEFTMFKDRDNVKFDRETEIIIVDEKGNERLEDFSHPKKATYVFGRTGMDLRLVFPQYRSVRIDTPYRSPMFGCVACGIILEDRKREWLQ